MNNTTQLPLKGNLRYVYTLSFIVATLMVAASLTGLFLQTAIYPTDELRQSFVSNDVVNLFIGLPILLGSMWLTKRGKLIGLIFWPGALFYITYNYAAYAVARPFTLPFWAYLALVFLSLYTMILLLTRIDPLPVRERLMGRVKERLGGGVLAGFGLLFFVWRLFDLVQASTGQAALTEVEKAVSIVDLVVIPTWIIGGVMLWRRQAFGYLTGAGLLFQASMLFIGLLVFFILQPFLANVPFPVEDFVVIAIMSLICLVPFGLFLRGVGAKG
jgi:hypothetical protein